MSERLWWRDGVIYQIYPRSYMDSNGDGIGDLEGIRRKLDHLAWLGVDGIWISPFFPSPMADFGYDVADYCDVDPQFGDLASFERLLDDAHERGIRVILDWVPNHSSDRHAWFERSRSREDDPHRDWYVWRPPAPDGGPPNNWRAVFGGPAWTLDARTGEYYLHSFLPQQPDLNWHSPELVRAMHDGLRFWLERGVDGFRIDVVHMLAKDAELRDNPPGDGRGHQQQLYNENRPEVHAVLRGVRELVDRYPERMLVGEVYLMDPVEVARYYGRGDELHLAFNFSFLRAPWSAEAFGSEIERFLSLVPPEPDGWADWTLSNHDQHRHASRYDHPTLGDARARLAAVMLLTLRGTPFLYYGEEIGMRDSEVPPARMRDPVGFRIDPKFSRDPERAPMQWEPGPGGGFTTGEPWLPLAADADTRNVAAQRADSDSLLHLYRELIALRREQPALARGAWRRIPTPAPDVLAYERSGGGGLVRVVLNFGDEPRVVDLGKNQVTGGLRTDPARGLPVDASAVEIGPAEGVVLVLAV